MNLNETKFEPDAWEELEILRAHLKQFREDIKTNPELATRFLQDIGLLDAEGNRVQLPGEEHLHFNGDATNNGGNL